MLYSYEAYNRGILLDLQPPKGVDKTKEFKITNPGGENHGFDYTKYSYRCVVEDVHTMAGAEEAGDDDGSCRKNRFDHPGGMVLKDASTLLISDTNNKKIKSLDLVTGRVETLLDLDFAPLNLSRFEKLLIIADSGIFKRNEMILSGSYVSVTTGRLLATDSHECIFAVNPSQNCVVVYDSQLDSIATWMLPNEYSSKIVSVALSTQLYVATEDCIFVVKLVQKIISNSSSTFMEAKPYNSFDIEWELVAGAKYPGCIDGPFMHALVAPIEIAVPNFPKSIPIDFSKGEKMDGEKSPLEHLVPSIGKFSSRFYKADVQPGTTSTSMLYFLNCWDDVYTIRALSPDGVVSTLLSPDPTYTSVAYILKSPRNLFASKLDEFRDQIFLVDGNRILRVVVQIKRFPNLFPLSLLPDLPKTSEFPCEEKYAFLDDSTLLGKNDLITEKQMEERTSLGLCNLM